MISFRQRVGFVLFLLWIGLGCSPKKQQSVIHIGWETIPTVTEARKKIDAELKILKEHHWAGFYSQGNGFGVETLGLASKSGFVYIHSGCVGICDQNYGWVAWDKNRVKLFPTLEQKNESMEVLPTEYLGIRWGERRYMIPIDDMVGFCNSVNSGDVRFLLHNEDQRKAAEGFPEVPEEFKPYLLEKPVEGEIIAVGETTKERRRSSIENVTPVTINKGKKDGLLPDMQFFAFQTDSESPFFSPIKLIKVDDEQSEGVVEYSPTLSPPQVSWLVSTRLAWKRVEN